MVRKAANRTIETVCDIIGTVLDCLTPPDECPNYLANAGYDRK